MGSWTPSRSSSCGAAKPEKGGEEPQEGLEGGSASHHKEALRRNCACPRGCTNPVYGREVVCDYCYVETSPQPQCDCGECCGNEDGDRDRSIASPDPADDQMYHIVQDEAKCAHVHSEVLPPDEYYDKLAVHLRRAYPRADPELVDHVVSLAAAFDTASAFALSFGIAKFQLAQAGTGVARTRS